MNTKAVAILLVAIAATTIVLTATGALSIPQDSVCNTENSTLLTGSVTITQSTSSTYTVTIHNGQSQEVSLTSYTLGTRSFTISLAVPAGQDASFTTVQDANSETRILVNTSCGNQLMATLPGSAAYTENMAQTSTAFQDSTKVTVDLVNNGNGTATLTSYNITDSAGNEYTLKPWNGPSLAPNSVTTTIFNIGSGCSQCVLYGSAFTFTGGHQYTIKIVTGRGNIFTFTVTKPSSHHYSIVLDVGFGSVAR